MTSGIVEHRPTPFRRLFSRVRHRGCACSVRGSPPPKPDLRLAIGTAYKADQLAQKIDLGVYRTETGAALMRGVKDTERLPREVKPNPETIARFTRAVSEFF